MTRKCTLSIRALVFVLLMGGFASAVVMISDKGDWPADWPKSLEPLRGSARTLEVAAGNQENIYEITFSNRESFEKAWPDILALKTPGAPLKLASMKVDPAKPGDGLESNAAPIVRIYAPASNAAVLAKDGTRIKADAPWPKDLVGPNGELPEYVLSTESEGKQRWVAVDKTNDKTVSFFYRARIDIELVVDGKVIDLNRIKLPENTPIVDKRF